MEPSRNGTASKREPDDGQRLRSSDGVAIEGWKQWRELLPPALRFPSGTELVQQGALSQETFFIEYGVAKYAYGYGFYNTCYPIASNACISEGAPEANYCEFTHCDYAYPPYCGGWGAHDGGACKPFIDACFGAPQWNACTC